MYHIMICDDDRVYAEYLASLLSKYQDERNVLNIDICESGEEIIKQMDDGIEYLKRSNKKTYLLGHIRANKYKVLSKNIMFIENGKRGRFI